MKTSRWTRRRRRKNRQQQYQEQRQSDSGSDGDNSSNGTYRLEYNLMYTMHICGCAVHYIIPTSLLLLLLMLASSIWAKEKVCTRQVIVLMWSDVHDAYRSKYLLCKRSTRTHTHASNVCISRVMYGLPWQILQWNRVCLCSSYTHTRNTWLSNVNWCSCFSFPISGTCCIGRLNSVLLTQLSIYWVRFVRKDE